MAASTTSVNPFTTDAFDTAGGNSALSNTVVNSPSLAGEFTPPPTTATQPGVPQSNALGIMPGAGNNTTMILSARGAFYQVSLAQNAAGASKAFYDVDNLTINPDQTSPQSPILLTGVQFRDSDIVGRVPCLNNYKVYYSFGQNFGDISIAGEVFLGPLGGVKTDGVNRLRNFFAKYRVSVYNKPIMVSIVDKAYYVYLEGLQIMAIDAMFHIMPFVMFGTLVDISRTASSLLNPTTVVLSTQNLTDNTLAKALSVSNQQVADIASQASTPAPVTEESSNPVATNPFDIGDSNTNPSATASSTAQANAASSTNTTSANAPSPSPTIPDIQSLSTPPPTSPLPGSVTDPNAAITADTLNGNQSAIEKSYPTLVSNTQSAQATLDNLNYNASNPDAPNAIPVTQQQLTTARNNLAAAQAAQTTAGNYIVNTYNKGK